LSPCACHKNSVKGLVLVRFSQAFFFFYRENAKWMWSGFPLRLFDDSHARSLDRVGSARRGTAPSRRPTRGGVDAAGGMAGARQDPPPRNRGVDDAPRLFAAGAPAAHAAPMSGSDAAGAPAPPAAAGERTPSALVSAACIGVLLAALGTAALGNGAALQTPWRDASPAVGAAVMQLVALVVCICGHLSPSSKGATRRKYGGLLLLAIVAGSELPAAGAVSPQPVSPADDMLGDITTWARQSLQEPAPPSSRPALDNQTNRPSGASAAGLLPKGNAPDDAAVLRERAAARRLLQWPSGVSDADRSPTPDPQFLKEEKGLKDMSKRMEAGLERCALSLGR